MNVKQFLLILRARYKVVLLALLGTVTITLFVSSLLPKQYTATSSVVVDSDLRIRSWELFPRLRCPVTWPHRWTL